MIRFLYVQDPYEEKHQLLINKHEGASFNHYNDSKTVMEYSNDMDDIYGSTEKYNPNEERKILVVFDGMIADMLRNKKRQQIVRKLFIRGRKLNISLLFITQYYFAVPKINRLNSTHYFIMKIPNKQELQQIAINHSLDIYFKHFMNLSKKCTGKSIFFNDTALASDNSLRFRCNILERK